MSLLAEDRNWALDIHAEQLLQALHSGAGKLKTLLTIAGPQAVGKLHNDLVHKEYETMTSWWCGKKAPQDSKLCQRRAFAQQLKGMSADAKRKAVQAQAAASEAVFAVASVGAVFAGARAAAMSSKMSRALQQKEEQSTTAPQAGSLTRGSFLSAAMTGLAGVAIGLFGRSAARDLAGQCLLHLGGAPLPVHRERASLNDTREGLNGWRRQ